MIKLSEGHDEYCVYMFLSFLKLCREDTDFTGMMIWEANSV